LPAKRYERAIPEGPFPVKAREKIFKLLETSLSSRHQLSRTIGNYIKALKE
jgi:hypothetical protein